MKIERYVAQDTKTAMALVRADLGPDALILANRRVDNRVEVTAGIQVEEGVDEWAHSRRSARGDAQTIRPTRARKLQPASQQAQNEPVNEIQLKALERELHRLRGLLESELGDRQWRDAGNHKAPVVALRQRLLRMGLSRSLAGSLIDKSAKSNMRLEALWAAALGELRSRFRVFDDDPKAASIYALFGSTGVGKTSTIAKLAGRDVQRFGSERVGLITLDNYRIGAREQLNSFAEAIGVPVLVADDRHSLAVALKELRGRRVYIDTAGMGQHDARLKRQMAVVSGQRQAIHKLLVLPASTQGSQLLAMTSVFAPPEIGGAIITKTDEALNLGGVIDVIVRSGLPLHSVADGQRIPENLHRGDPKALVRQAAELMQHEEARPGVEFRQSA